MGGVIRIFALLGVALFAVCCGNVESATVTEDRDVASKVSYVEEAITGDASMVEYVVVSKESMRLKVYDANNRLVASFGVAVGSGEGDKREAGDMCTPEGEFTISSIEDAGDWLYDDGSGIKEGYYGDWFIRLSTPFQGIGIHGTADASIIGTRSTEGSIRLVHSDLNALKALVREGMLVRIVDKDYRVAEARAVITEGQHEKIAAAVEPVSTEVDSGAAQSITPSAPTGDDADAEVWHKVVDGELLGRIAQRYGTTVANIKRLNPDIDVDRISIGQRILISDGTKSVDLAPKSSVVESSAGEVQEQGDEVWYTLQDGDLVGRVALRFGTTTKRIAELNPGINVDKVRSGQRIRVK